jgi:large subunit ribosomal protein L25
MDEVRVDVSGLALGQSLHVRELSLPENVTVVTDGASVVATVRLPKGEAAEEEAEEVAEAEQQPQVISEQKREEREKDKEAE